MLEYYTTTELIEEISKRSTFVGVLIQSKKENKNNTKHKFWDITYSNLTENQVKDIMKWAAKHFKNLADNNI